jgi:hypothetical protein
MIVVGHCPTNGYNSLATIMNTNKLYENCDRLGGTIKSSSKGCVVTNCSDIQNPGAPTLAFVDTSMSSAFRSRNISIDTIDVNLSDKDKAETSLENKHRINEMLHLHHDLLLGGTNRYYNVISRLVLSNDKTSDEILLYKAASKDEHNIKYIKQMKYLKYKLKYYYLVQKS